MTVVGGTTVSIPTRVLVIGMAHEDGTILASELYPVAEACGQTAEQVRSCLRRLVAEGVLVRNAEQGGGSGTTARDESTAQGMAVLGANIERTRLAYAQDAAGRGWDRQWRPVGFAVPRRRRTARDTFRDRLTALGGAAIQGGLYVSAHPWHKDVKAEAERLGVAELVTYAVTEELSMGDQHDPREIARRLWPVGDLASRYDTFAKEFAAVP